MGKILRESDHGVVVYVAPTKALVNQIAAEVQSRFRKNTQKPPGRTVWANHTRDYRINNSSNCQILVTVPHFLQIMLISPSNAPSWSPKVKSIIFDEVHRIGEDDGMIWEQLLIMAPCPIIALSATVGNVTEFRAVDRHDSSKHKGDADDGNMAAPLQRPAQVYILAFFSKHQRRVEWHATRWRKLDDSDSVRLMLLLEFCEISNPLSSGGSKRL